MASIPEEDTRLLESVVHTNSVNSPNRTTTKVYKRRWYVLAVFTAQALIYNLAWNRWAPIQEVCKIAFDWSDFNILLLSSWAAIALLASSFPLTWLLHAKGLRIPMLLAAFLCVVGKSLQAITFSSNRLQTIFINLGQFILMISGPITLGAPPLVSSTWFPPSERTTATAVGTLAGYFGIALAFSVGPAVVGTAGTVINSSSSSSAPRNIPLSVRTMMKDRVMDYTYFEIGLCMLVFLCVLVYFPSKPPLPPSVTPSSVSPHASKGTSIRQVVNDCQLWWLIILGGLPFGIYYGWLSMLDVFLAMFGVKATTAGWLGCSTTMAGVVSGLVLARFADRVKHRTKQLLIFLLMATTVSQLIFSLSCSRILPSTKPFLYGSIISGGFYYNGTLPLFFELAMEHVYPVGEGIAGGMLVTAGNVVLLVFYIVFMLPNSDLRWMNWVTVGGIGFCSLGLLFYREKYKRLGLETDLHDGEKNEVLRS